MMWYTSGLVTDLWVEESVRESLNVPSQYKINGELRVARVPPLEPYNNSEL